MLAEKIQLEEDEYILAQVRKHWFVLTVQILGVVAVALLPIAVLLVAVGTSAFSTTLSALSVPLASALCFGWLILSWMALGSVWTNYYLDVWTITNKRLIAVDQRGLFNRSTGSFRLERLQDINVTVRGIIPTFLDFGNLEAETASDDKEFVARSVAHPQELKALILRATDAITYNGVALPKHGTEV